MSLSQRVTAIEEHGGSWSRDSSTSSRHRKMSFNPVGAWTEPAGEEPTIGAFEVPKWKRLLQVGLAVVYCLFAAGIVFGYAAIKPVLLEEGVYRNLCTRKELEEHVVLCYQQELRLNLMFTVAAVSTNVAALPVGTILDRYGPRTTSIIGALSIALGAVLFAFASQLPFDAYIPGYLFLALGGPFIFIPSFQLSNTFPQHAGLILALLTGAFDTSSAIFLIYRLIYQASRNNFRVRKFFLLYLFVPAFILVVQLLVMPAASYKTVGELVTTVDDTQVEHDSDDEINDAAVVQHLRDARRAHRDSIVSEITSLLGTKDGAKQAQEEKQKKNVSGVWGALHGQTATQQIRTPWFILITLFTILQMSRINYFVATIRTQYTYLFHSYDKAVEINNFFDVALPAGGVFSVPFIGLLLDNTSTRFTLALLVSIATTIGILGVIPEPWAAYGNIILFVLYRPLYYTAVSDYAAKVFGFATFGTVYGLIICLAGLFNFSQSALDAATHRLFHGNPIPINLLLLTLTLLVGALLVAFVASRCHPVTRDGLEEAAVQAEEVLMPGGSTGYGSIGHGSSSPVEEGRGRRG